MEAYPHSLISFHFEGHAFSTIFWHFDDEFEFVIASRAFGYCKHLIFAVSNFRGLMKMTYWRS